MVTALISIGVLDVSVDGLRNDVNMNGVGVVLGSKVVPDRTPSNRSRAPLDKAAQPCRWGMFKRIMVSALNA